MKSIKHGVPEESGGASSAGTRIQSVARSCQLLLWLAERESGAMAKEVAFANRLTLPTTYHLLNTLVDQGLLAKDKRRRYTLGRSTAILARAYSRGASVPVSLLEALRELGVRTGETTYLADWGEHDIRVLASVEGTHVLRVAEVGAGPYDDGHARATGKVLLAHALPEARQAYFAAHPIRGLTDATIVDPAALDLELARIRERGYAYDEQEFAEGVSCVAAPLLGREGIIAAFGISVPTERFVRTREELTTTLLELVADTAAGAFEPALAG